MSEMWKARAESAESQLAALSAGVREVGALCERLRDEAREQMTNVLEYSSAYWHGRKAAATEVLMAIARLPADTGTATTPRAGWPSTEEQVIEHCVGHWFAQGGKAEFGMIPECQNADELISAILYRVRNPNPDSWTTDDAPPAGAGTEEP